MSKVTDVLDIVKEMTVLELSELVKAFEEEFGVEIADKDIKDIQTVADIVEYIEDHEA